MSEPPALGWRDRLKVASASAVLHLLIRTVGASCRLQKVVGEEHLQGWLESDQPVVLCLWHDRLFYLSYFLWRRAIRRGKSIQTLVSRSKDGELLARTTRRLGYVPTRGSSSRGAVAGLRQLARIVRSEGKSVATVGDGPRGPRHECKAGPVALAKLTGAAILPIAYAARPAKILNTWDRLLLPRPFARTVVAFGSPIIVPRDLPAERQEEQVRTLEHALNQLVERAERELAAT